ncbi:hypothetical protein [Murinocardiopsis flavida]|uniref:hypothetical protein n=1 Tax=Murinocardiopsis flavida TaxID=645275 RepID=UPI000D0E2095|nr:hypothetical protein [Murinocardiopsis flavida]
MSEHTASVLRRPLIRGVLLLVAVCMYLLCSLCLADGSHASTAAEPAAATASTASAAPAAHGHGTAHECDSSGAAAEQRAAPPALFLPALAGVLVAGGLWLARAEPRIRSPFLRYGPRRHGAAPLLVTLCISRV